MKRVERTREARAPFCELQDSWTQRSEDGTIWICVDADHAGMSGSKGPSTAVLVSLMESAAHAACLSKLGTDVDVATQQFTLHQAARLRSTASRAGVLRACSSVTGVSEHVVCLESKIYDSAGTLIASMVGSAERAGDSVVGIALEAAGLDEAAPSDDQVTAARAARRHGGGLMRPPTEEVTDMDEWWASARPLARGKASDVFQ